MIEIKDKIDCCGCNACGDICPKDCITFKTDIEGFWYPEVDMDKCINCHLCEKVCPNIHYKELKKNEFKESECYAAINKNIEVRFDSTSGGIFSALAMGIYKQGGYVGGAIFDDQWMVDQYISKEKSDLDRLRSSKYLQSDANGFYKRVAELVKAGEKVLVCGTPCQMAALRRFLRKDYDNLIIVDFICRGINSRKVFRKYLDYLELKYQSKVTYFKAKNKELGWRELTSKVMFENGKVLYDTRDTSYFTTGYLQTGVYCRPSCYDCKFRGFPRIADITIADYWGAEKTVGKNLDNDLGTSLVMINNNKGKTYYESIKKNLNDVRIPFESILRGNPALTTSLDPPVVDRDQFYRDLDEKPFKEIAAKYITRSIDRTPDKRRKIKNFLKFWWNLLHIAGWNIPTWYKNIKYNFLKKQIHTDILLGYYLLITKHTILTIRPEATVNVGGHVILGWKKYPSSHLETRILVENGSLLDFKGNADIGYGSDIEVFEQAVLKIGKGFASNIETTIVCGENIDIGDFVKVGRGCTIRDNNGSHFMSRRGYKNTRPVVIGQHAWLCEGCTLLGGAKLGTGAIVSAKALVGIHVPAFAMALGNPAEIVDEDIYWKY